MTRGEIGDAYGEFKNVHCREEKEKEGRRESGGGEKGGREGTKKMI